MLVVETLQAFLSFCYKNYFQLVNLKEVHQPQEREKVHLYTLQNI